MRPAIAGALFACLFSSAAFAAASVEANDSSDRHAETYRLAPAANFICQPPELAELSKEARRALCVQADILANLATTGPELKAAATSPFLQHPFLKDFQKEPYRGLDAITCRGAGQLTCAHNSYWAFEDRPRPMGSPEVAPYLGSPADNPPPRAISP
jgi:hypothetical protein